MTQSPLQLLHYNSVLAIATIAAPPEVVLEFGKNLDFLEHSCVLRESTTCIVSTGTGGEHRTRRTLGSLAVFFERFRKSKLARFC